MLSVEQHIIFRCGGQESIVQRGTGLARLSVDELAAHPVLGGQITDRLGPGQHLDGQVLTAALRQPRRRATTPIHVRTTVKKSGWQHLSRRSQPGGV
jgi:hypothetical protein